MKSRSIPLFLIAVFLTIAPAAMADHCKRCAQIPVTHCVNAINVSGFAECVVVDLECVFSGDPCGPEAPMAALASEYKVVAVERLDEPKPPATELLDAGTDPKLHTR
jgi:hypothetical protein